MVESTCGKRVLSPDVQALGFQAPTVLKDVIPKYKLQPYLKP